MSETPPCPDLPELAAETLNALRSTIAEWKFQPFLVNGQLSQITAELTITISPNGQVRSSLRGREWPLKAACYRLIYCG